MKRRAAISFLCAAAAGIAGPALAQKDTSDDSIYDNVRRRLASDPTVKGGGLEVDVQKGVVTLRGSVELDKQKTRAEKLTRKVSGVKQVVNQLQVRRPGAK